MKKSCLIPILSVAFLVGFGPDSSKETTHHSIKTLTNSAHMTPAEEAESAFRKLIQSQQKFEQKFFDPGRVDLQINHTVTSYEKKHNEAKALVRISMKLNSFEEPLNVDIQHDVKYDQTVLDSGLIAKINTKIIKPKKIKDKSSKSLLNTLSKSFTSVTSISRNHDVTQNIILEPFTGDNGKEMEFFNGAEINVKTRLQDIEKGFGEFVLDIKGVKRSKNIYFEPISLKGRYSPNGDVKIYLLAPIVFDDMYDNMRLSVRELTYSGNQKYNEKYQLMLGDLALNIEDIQVSGKKSGELSHAIPDEALLLNIKSIKVMGNDKVTDQGLFSSNYNYGVIFSEEVSPESFSEFITPIFRDFFVTISRALLRRTRLDIFTKLTVFQETLFDVYMHLTTGFFEGDLVGSSEGISQGGLKLSKLNLHCELNNLPASAVPYYKEMRMPSDVKTILLFAQIIKSDTNTRCNFDMETNLGRATLEASAEFKNNDKTKLFFEEFMQSNHNHGMDAFAQLIDLDITLNAPEKLLEAIAENKIMMMSIIMNKIGNTYKSKISTKKGDFRINDIPVPF